MLAKTKPVTISLLLLLVALPIPGLAADCIWNGSVNSDWLNSGNWTNCTPDMAGERAIFNSGSVSATLNAVGVTIDELVIKDTYSGTVTLKKESNTIGMITMTTATLKLGAPVQITTDKVSITGGTLDASDEGVLITCNGDWTVTGTYMASGTDTNTINIDQTSSGTTINHGANPADSVNVINKGVSRITTWASTNTIRRLTVDTTNPGPPVSTTSKLVIMAAKVLTVTGSIANLGIIEENGTIKHLADLLEVDDDLVPTFPPTFPAVTSIPAGSNFFVRLKDDDENLLGSAADLAAGVTVTNTANADSLTLTLNESGGVFVSNSIPTQDTAGAIVDGILQVQDGNTVEIKYTDDEDATDMITSMFTIGAAVPPTDTTTTTILSDTPDPSLVGEPVTVTFSVTVNPPGVGPATGTVAVNDGGGATCMATLPVTSCDLTPTLAGPKTLTATYSGGGAFIGSSDTETHLVNLAGTTTTIVSDLPDPSIVGQAVSVVFTVSVNAPGTGTPTGNVTVSDNTGATCMAAVAAGSCTLTPASAGVKTLTAAYSGSVDFGPSSDTESHQVNPAGGNALPTIGPSNQLEFAQVAVGAGFRAFLSLFSTEIIPVQATASFMATLGGSLANLEIDGVPAASKTVTIPALGKIQLKLTSSDPSVISNGWARVTANGNIGGVLIYQLFEMGSLVSQASVGPSPRLRNFVIDVAQLSALTQTGLAIVNVDSVPASVNIAFFTPDPAGLAPITQTNIVFAIEEHQAFFISALFTSPPITPTGTVKVTSDKDLIAVGLYFQGNIFTPAPVLPVP